VCRKFREGWACGFWATVASKGSPFPSIMLYGTVVLSVLSLTLVYCGQTDGWIKMPLGTELGLGPGDIVLDGLPASPPPRKGTQQPPPNFRPMSVAAKRSPISAIAELFLKHTSGHTDRQTDRQTYTLIAMLRSPTGGKIIKPFDVGAVAFDHTLSLYSGDGIV